MAAFACGFGIVAVIAQPEVEAGFVWVSFASGALCTAGIINTETGVGVALAAAGCGAAFLSD